MSHVWNQCKCHLPFLTEPGAAGLGTLIFNSGIRLHQRKGMLSVVAAPSTLTMGCIPFPLESFLCPVNFILSTASSFDA